MVDLTIASRLRPPPPHGAPINDFWKTPEAVEPGKGWEFFGGYQFLWLAFGVLFIIGATLSYRLCGEKGRAAWRLALGVYLTLDTLACQILFIVTRQWTVFRLPMHMCDVASILVALHCIFPKCKPVASLCYAFSPGALLALATPIWHVLPEMSFYAIMAWTFHIFLIAYPVMIIGGGDYHPDFADLKKALPFVLLGIAIIQIVNINLGTDFLFINGSYTVEWMHAIYNIMGPAYIIVFAAIMAVLFTAEFLPFYLIDKKNEKKGKAKGKRLLKGFEPPYKKHNRWEVMPVYALKAIKV